MTWSSRQRWGLFWTMFGTALVIAISLYWAWHVSDGWSGMQGMSFLTFSLIYSAVILAIGGVMAIFIVMIIGKNEKAERNL